jgi:hypothetical protein
MGKKYILFAPVQDFHQQEVIVVANEAYKNKHAKKTSEELVYIKPKFIFISLTLLNSQEK